MILEICIVVVAIYAFSFFVGFLYQLYYEYNHFNGGICPKCGKPLKEVDVYLGGDRGYYCPDCFHVALVKFHWIDKKFKKKESLVEKYFEFLKKENEQYDVYNKIVREIPH